MIATGVVTTLAGTPVAGAVDATGVAASFSNPTGITRNGLNLYVTDMTNNKIRQIVIATGVVTSVTGVANMPNLAGAMDGAAGTATFTSPMGILSVGTTLFVADTRSTRIRQIQ